jgi:hypothetical protein
MEIIRREPSLHGEIGLWLVILFDVIEALRKVPETRQDLEDQELAGGSSWSGAGCLSMQRRFWGLRRKACEKNSL